MFEFIPKKRYLMPVHFGPQPGICQPPAGFTPDHARYPKRRTAFVHYLTRAEQLARLLPTGFTLWGAPVISFEISHHTEVEWLAGRSYGVFGVNYPVRYEGRRETVHGTFRSVTWENLPDAVTWGREELGCHKLYCEIPEPTILKGDYDYHASLYGNRFFELKLRDLQESDPDQPGRDRPFMGAGDAGHENQGLLFYKYIPSVDEPGVADVAYPVLLPADYPLLSIKRSYSANGSAVFRKLSWRDLPMYHHVVEALADLDLLECRGASLSFSEGGKDLSDMRRIDRERPTHTESRSVDGK